MYVDQIRYFLDVAETLSVNQSATGLFISPQGLSRSISQLEKEVGLTLFVRTNRGMKLTSAGKQFKEYALALWQAYCEFERNVARIDDGAKEAKGESINLAVAPLISVCDLLPDIMGEIAGAFPGEQLNITELASNALTSFFENMSDEELSRTVAIATIPEYQMDSFVPDDKRLSVTELRTVPMVASVDREHPLASKRLVTRAELAREEILCFNEPVLEEIAHYLLDEYGGPKFAFKGSIRNLVGRFPHAVAISALLDEKDASRVGGERIVSVPIRDTVRTHIVAIAAEPKPLRIRRVIDCVARAIGAS